MKKLIVGNWKQNKTAAEVLSFAKSITHFEVAENKEMVITPCFAHLALLGDNLPKGVKLGAQTVSPYKEGKYTGGVGALQLKDLGVSYVIAGHSERRRYFNETPSIVNNQIRELVSVGITPIICFSSIEELKAVEVNESLAVFAYEPLSAIGTGEMADLERIQEMVEAYGDIYPNTPLLYGGSVSPENVAQLNVIKGIIGILVGSDSLEPDKFLDIYKNGFND